MAYSKTTWQDLPSQTTPLNATNLNNIETGIEDNDKRLNGTSVAGDMVVNSITAKNMFDMNNVLVGKLLKTYGDGGTEANADWNSSYYIAVKPNTTYTYTTVNPGTTTNQIIINQYNGTTFVTGSQYNQTGGGTFSYTFTTGSTTTNVRLGYRNANNYQNIQLEEGSTATAYTPYQNLNPDVADTGWVTATLSSYFTAYNTGTTPQYRRIGKIVNIRGVVKPTSTISNTQIETTIFTLPEGFRISGEPEIEQLCQGSGSNKWLLTIRPNGVVAFSRYGISQYDSAANTVWLPFNITYFID